MPDLDNEAEEPRRILLAGDHNVAKNSVEWIVCKHFVALFIPVTDKWIVTIVLKDLRTDWKLA